MKKLLLVAPLFLAWGCASAGTAEEFTWAIECPKTVDQGAEFSFMVTTTRTGGPVVPGVRYFYQIDWAGGGEHHPHHTGWSGTAEIARVALHPGKAHMIVTCDNKGGVEVKVLETTFEVK